MARKKTEIIPISPDTPVYTIGVAARLVNVHPRTLRIYEKEGLIHPAHEGSRRFFSENDIHWILCLRSMIHDDGISINGLKKLLQLVPCWEITDCPSCVHEKCAALVDRSVPKTLYVVGDDEAARKAKEADQVRRKKVAKKSRHRLVTF
jgi:MerR family transcriptional regulator/heat shock protein HspR